MRWTARLLVPLLLLAACGGSGEAGDAAGGSGGSSGSGGSPGSEAGSAGAPADWKPTEADFECLTRWDRVRRFRITNRLDALDEALAVANSPDGGVYPAGTIIQLVPFEAMAKRSPGWNAPSGDWEFFELQVSQNGTTINKRGTSDVVNQFGGNCFDCHSQAEPQWDFVCEQDHGCAPLPLNEDIVTQLQTGDPRCP